MGIVRPLPELNVSYYDPEPQTGPGLVPLMPFGCGDCGAEPAPEITEPGTEPDHFGWCPLVAERATEPEAR